MCALVICYRKCGSLNWYWIILRPFSEGPQIIIKHVNIGGVLLFPTFMYLEFKLGFYLSQINVFFVPHSTVSLYIY